MGGFVRLRPLATSLLHTFFPPACPLCLKSLPAGWDTDFCPECSADLKPLPGAHCPYCALPFQAEEGSSHLCSQCLRQSPPFARVFAYGLYERSLRDAIHQFKFNRKAGLDRSLGRLLEQAIDPALEIDLVVPVPLQNKRLKQRSYNQALLLAREVGRLRSWLVDSRLLLKSRETEQQHDLPAKAREKNLRDAFHVLKDISDKRVLLVDDVMTTGATAAACSRVLVEKGAANVSVAVVARAAKW